MIKASRARSALEGRDVGGPGGLKGRLEAPLGPQRHRRGKK